MSATYQKTVYSQSIEQKDIMRNETLNSIIKNIAKKPHQNLLDVGCGNGHLLAEVEAEAPIKIGEPIVQNIFNTGVNIVATKNISKKE